MSGLPKSGNGWAIYEVRALDKDAAIKRQICSTIQDDGLARQAPLHRLHAAGKFEARVGGSVVCPNAARLLRIR